MSLALLFVQHVSNASTFILTEQYTHTQSQAREDECTGIRNMLSKKIKQMTSVGLSLFN